MSAMSGQSCATAVEDVVERAGLDDLEVALAREQVAHARAEDLQRVGDEDASAPHVSLLACAAFSLCSYGRAYEWPYP